MKKSLILVGLLSIGYAHAQEGRVGINTETPKATLDIKSINTDQAKGILTPQLTGDELKTMTSSLTEDQHGMVTFAKNGVTTPDASTNNVQFVGYHRFNLDGNSKSWVRLEPSGLEKIKGDGNNIGWALIGRDATKYGSIGLKSVDISEVNSNAKSGVVMGATGNHSFATGLNTSASGWNSTTIGNATIASGSSSIAMGSEALAKGNYSLAAGIGSQATGWNSIAMGNKVVASGSSSIAFGNSTVASNSYSFVSGNQTQSTGWASTAIGSNAIASGSVATALGSAAVAEGNYSFATGNHAKANGLASIAIGFSVVAKQEQEIAMGLYNTEQTALDTLPSWGDGRVLVVGNGRGNYDNVAQERSDAFTILRNGKVGIDIDNFETTTSDAKLQVNGKILANSLAGVGDRPVYADENGVLKIGAAPAGGGAQGITTEQDGIVGNEVVDVVANRGLERKGTGTAVDPYKVGLIAGTKSGQTLVWNGSAWELQSPQGGASLDSITGGVKVVTAITKATWSEQVEGKSIFALSQTGNAAIQLPNPADYKFRIIAVNNQYTNQLNYAPEYSPTYSVLDAGKGHLLISDGQKWMIIGGSF